MHEPIEWEKKYSVQIESLDAQHKKFFDLINHVYQVVNTSNKSSFKNQILEALIGMGRYAFYHLENEEKYFKEFNFEGETSHCVQHEMFREKVSEFLRRARDENSDIEVLGVEIAEFAESWLENHILVCDKLYTECFKQHHLK